MPLLTEEARTVLDRLYAADAAQREAGLPSSRRTRNVGPETGLFLAFTARALNASRVVEMGSSNGVSTIWLAAGVAPTRGRVTGTELLPDRASEATANIREAGLADIAHVVAGDAGETAAALDGPLDLVFIDAEKEDYISHFAALVDRVRPGGLILADNVISHDIGAYQTMLRGRTDVETMTLPLDRGIEYTVKL